MSTEPTIALPRAVPADWSGEDLGGPRGRGAATDRAPGPGLPWPVLVGLVVAAQLVMILDVDVPVLRPALAAITLLGLPTLVLHRRAGLPGDSALVRLLYSFGAALLGLVLVGLLLNTVLPLLGDDHPLGPAALGVAYLVVDVALVLWRRSVPLVGRIDALARLRRLASVRWEPAQALASAGLVLAVAGAVRLNNGADGHVALVAHVLAAGALVALMVSRSRTDLGRDARVLVLVAATLLLATSLRGWGITGHDIQAEYYAFSLTNDHQHWATDVLQNAYNACLSVTLLPSMLAQASGLPGVVVFKVVLQLVFVLVPLLTFLLSRRFLPRGLALAATTFTMAFPTFFTDMPYLVRQEVAFFFLGLLLLAATERDVEPRRLRLLVGFFGLGVVLSHYSTTYLLVIGLVVGLLLIPLFRLWTRKVETPADRRPLVLLNPLVIVFLAVAGIVWAGPVTHTGSHVGEVLRDTVATVLGHGDHSPGSSDVSWSIFSGHDPGPRKRLDKFVDETLDLRKPVPEHFLLVKHPGHDELKPDIVEARTMPLTWLGHAADSVGIDPGTLTTLARLGCAALMQVFLLVGLVVLLVRARRGRHGDLEGRLAPELTCVAFGVMAALGLVVVIPNLSVEYGVLRAFQQTLMFVAPLMAVGMWTLLRPLGRRAAALVVAVPVLVLLVLSGVLPTFLGGHQARLALENAGLYYDRYIAADSDVTSMSWLTKAPDNKGPAPKVIAGRSYVTPIVTAGLAPAEVVDRLYPTLLTTGSYVFVDSRLERTHQSTIFYSGDRITYRYPMHDLDRLLDLVYSSGHSKVYR